MHVADDLVDQAFLRVIAVMLLMFSPDNFGINGSIASAMKFSVEARSFAFDPALGELTLKQRQQSAPRAFGLHFVMDP